MRPWYQRLFVPTTTTGKWLRVLGLLVSTSLLLVILVEGISLTVQAGSNTVIASDSFNRTVSNGWGTADQGGSWAVLDTPPNWSVAPGAGSIIVTANGQGRAVLGSVSVQDVDLLAKIVLPRCSGSSTNCDAYLIGRYTGGSTPSYYRIGAVQGQGHSTVFLRAQRSDNTNLSSDLNTGIAATNGVVLWVRVDFQGIKPTTIRARIWQNGTTEPTTWLLNTTDSNSAEQVAGAVGVRARNEDAAASHTFQYESYQATALSSNTPTPTPTGTSTTTPTTTSTTSGTVAADSFQRTAASGWGSADTGGWWTVVGSPWSWSVSPGAGSVTVGANGQERAYLSSFTTQNVDVVEKVVLPRCSGSTTCDAFVLGRYAPAYNPTYYRVGVVQGTARADIFLRAQRSDGTNLGGDLDTGLHAANGAVVWLHVEFQGVNPTAVRARAWLDGTTEPSTWLLNTTDSNSAEQKTGMVGLQMSNEDTATSHIFQVESYQATGTAIPLSVTPNPSGSTTAHWLYVVDDGTVYAYDIDNNNALVKQFPIPEAGKRGVAVAPQQGLLYITECGMSNCSGSHGSLLAYDLVHDVVAWIANYSFGADQLAVTPDGSKIYMPHGADASDGTYSILDASSGKPIGSIQTGTNGHNTIVSLDGAQVYLTGYTGSNYNYVHVVNPATNQVILNAGPTVNGVRPFTINGSHTLMFTTSTNTCGFQVLSLTTGKVLSTVKFSGSCSWSASNAPSHGISLSPDEKRVYVMDAPLDQLEVYDVSGLPTSAPKLVGSVSLTSLGGWSSPCQTYCEREGWVLNDLSGRYVYVGDTGDVVSTSTLKVVATLPPLQNTRQVIEVDWSHGTTSGTSTRFGLGRVTS
jgi:DNA-binding beta-propeller fold protein YncE